MNTNNVVTIAFILAAVKNNRALVEYQEDLVAKIIPVELQDKFKCSYDEAKTLRQQGWTAWWKNFERLSPSAEPLNPKSSQIAAYVISAMHPKCIAQCQSSWLPKVCERVYGKSLNPNTFEGVKNLQRVLRHNFPIWEFWLTHALDS